MSLSSSTTAAADFVNTVPKKMPIQIKGAPYRLNPSRLPQPVFHFALSGIICLCTCLWAVHARAWSERGHSIIAQTAAYLAADEPGAGFLKSRSFDLGYYANVPDKVWKAPATYEVEQYNHFMDMEVFHRALKADEEKKALAMDRVTFDSSYPSIPNQAGRAFWRIREFAEELDKVTSELKNPRLTTEQRHHLQSRWLILAGTLGHYVGDLAQPLHTTENYDGQMTGQKGVHAFFEGPLVDELFPGIENDTAKAAKARWRAFKKKNASRSLLDLIEELSNDSHAKLSELLKLDKKADRNDLKKAARAQRDFILGRLVTGSLVLAEIWRRDLGWVFDGNRFFKFAPAPEYIRAPAPPRAPSPQKSV